MVSKKPKKQRLERHSASLKERKNFVKSHLSRELRKELGVRNITVRKGDTLRVLAGEHKKHSGKALSIERKKARIFIEGLKVKKSDGTEKPLGINASNLLVVDIDRSDEKRFRKKLKKGKNAVSEKQAVQKAKKETVQAGKAQAKKAE